LLPKKAPLSDKTDQYQVTGEIYATGQYIETRASAQPESEGSIGPSRQLNHLPKNGKVVYAEIANYGKYSSENNSIERIFLGTVGVIRDVSDSKTLEEKQIELDQQILHSKKMEAIGVLAGGIAHDFNNLLQGVFGYISMAKLNLDQKGKCVEMIEQAEKALHLSVNLTKQLLTFSRGGKPLRKKMKILPIIENSVKFALSGSRIDYSLETDEALHLVEVDEGQISQVIQNIIINADQAMPTCGTVLVTARNVQAPGEGLPDHLPAGRYIRISIKDNGIGIPKHYLPRIFDPYFTTKDKGSGLGLAASYSIVRNHGGMIDVKSETGKGSTFSIYLPALDTEEQIIRPAPEAATAVRKGTILLMDDEKLIRDIVGVMLKALGHRVEFALNGEEALDKYQGALSSGRRFDIVILDLTIRGSMGGEETIQKLLEIDPDVKAIVSSGYADSSAISEYTKCGFKACLAKPYQVDTLRNMLDGLLNDQAA
jgi:signal transduction histidine kinase/ActR/RegA family two-component response regulator